MINGIQGVFTNLLFIKKSKMKLNIVFRFFRVDLVHDPESLLIDIALYIIYSVTILSTTPMLP